MLQQSIHHVLFKIHELLPKDSHRAVGIVKVNFSMEVAKVMLNEDLVETNLELSNFVEVANITP